MKRLSLTLLLFLSIFSMVLTSVHARKDATGADAIFDTIGVEKPTGWGDLSRTEKFLFLQKLGAYPANGDKYQGEIDLDRYFETLGVQEPENWMSLTNQERVDFIDALQESQEGVIGQNEQQLVDKSGKEYNFPFIGVTLVLLYLASLALVRAKTIPLVAQRRFWNIILGTFFLSTATLGLLLVVRISYGLAVLLPFNVLFWHVETGIVFSFIAIFHMFWHLYYFKLIFKK